MPQKKPCTLPSIGLDIDVPVHPFLGCIYSLLTSPELMKSENLIFKDLENLSYVPPLDDYKCCDESDSGLAYCLFQQKIAGANILPLTWVYKLKRYPDGWPQNFKVRLCIRGDMQVEGIDYMDKYAPVVNWSTVQLLMILTVREKLHTRLVNFTNAFAQAILKDAVYCELHKLYESTDRSGVVLKLNKSLCGLVQAPLCWYKHLREGLICYKVHTQWDLCL